MDRHLASTPDDSLYLLPYNLPKLLSDPLWSASGPLITQKLFAVLASLRSEHGSEGSDLRRILISTLIDLVQHDEVLDEKIKLIEYI